MVPKEEMLVDIEILVDSKDWIEQDPKIKNKIKQLIKKILPKTNLFNLSKTNLELSILLTDDQKIQELNKIYRHKNKPTNILSFPANDVSLIKNSQFEKLGILDNFLALGDLILSIDTIKKEAEEQNKIFEHHLFHLIIHGILHLIGFDHIDDDDALQMEHLEVRLLKNLDIKNPYILASDQI